MTTDVATKLVLPVRNILLGIAEIKNLPLTNFTEPHFHPKDQKEKFPHLSDLSTDLAFPYSLGIEIKKERITAFEGAREGTAVAYFGRNDVEQYSNITREFGLVYHQGRRIVVNLNENGKGVIYVRDDMVNQARGHLGSDSFGGLFDRRPNSEFGFKQRLENSDLPGVQAFLNYLVGIEE